MNKTKYNNKLTFAVAALIIAGLLIVAVATITMYKTYTQDSQIKSALQLAKNENRMVEIKTSNGIRAAFNLSSKMDMSVIPSYSQITHITVYPRQYKIEYIKIPGSYVTIVPYSLNDEL